MKRIMLLLCFLVVFINTYAQDKDFPGKRPALLTGKEVKVLPPDKYLLQYAKGYKRFYGGPKDISAYKKEDASSTKWDALSGRTFKVESVEPINDEKAMVKLKDAATGEIVYYRYWNKANEFKEYYFEVIGGLDLPNDFYCDYVTKQDLGSSVNYEISIVPGIKITKNIDAAKKEIYRIDIDTHGLVTDSTESVSIILENGTHIDRKEAAVANYVAGSSIKNITGFELTLKELELLKASKIVNIKLGASEKKVFTTEQIMYRLPCLMSKK